MWIFNRSYFALAIFIFALEVVIALFVHDNFVRPYVGDILVVILIYCFIKSFFRLPVMIVAMFVLLFAFTVELLQFLKIVEVLGLEQSTLARVVIGTSFSWWDILTYMVGMATVLIAEKYLARKESCSPIYSDLHGL